MIGRVLRALLGNTAAVPPPPPDVEVPAMQADDWVAGDLARCITSDWMGTPPPQGFPKADDTYRVTSVAVMFSTFVGRPLLMLSLEGTPGIYAAAAFEKVAPDLAPAPSWFTDELRSISERVKARQGGA